MIDKSMIVKSIEELTIYESPDGGKTIYSRKSGSSERTLHSIDPMYKKEQELAQRWVKLKEAVYLEDPAIDDLINKIEMLMELKK
jgi:hypothetical protein